jgi:hypothetical protein
MKLEQNSGDSESYYCELRTPPACHSRLASVVLDMVLQISPIATEAVQQLGIECKMQQLGSPNV